MCIEFEASCMCRTLLCEKPWYNLGETWVNTLDGLLWTVVAVSIAGRQLSDDLEAWRPATCEWMLWFCALGDGAKREGAGARRRIPRNGQSARDVELSFSQGGVMPAPEMKHKVSKLREHHSHLEGALACSAFSESIAVGGAALQLMREHGHVGPERVSVFKMTLLFLSCPHSRS